MRARMRDGPETVYGPGSDHVTNNTLSEAGLEGNAAPEKKREAHTGMTIHERHHGIPSLRGKRRNRCLRTEIPHVELGRPG